MHRGLFKMEKVIPPIVESTLCLMPTLASLYSLYSLISPSGLSPLDVLEFKWSAFNLVILSMYNCWQVLLVAAKVGREQRDGYIIAWSLPIFFAVSVLGLCQRHASSSLVFDAFYIRVLGVLSWHQLQVLVGGFISNIQTGLFGLTGAKYWMFPMGLAHSPIFSFFFAYGLQSLVDVHAYIPLVPLRAEFGVGSGPWSDLVQFTLCNPWFATILVVQILTMVLESLTQSAMTRGERFLVCLGAAVHLTTGLDMYLASTLSISPILVFSWSLVWGMIGIGFILLPFLLICRGAHESFLRILGSVLFYVSFAAIVLLVFEKWVGKWIGSEPFLWTFSFILDSSSYRPWITLYWVLFLLTGLGWIATSVREMTNDLFLDGRRKYFHVLAFFMLTPGLFLDMNYLHLGFSVAFAGLLLVEYVRYFELWPFWPTLDNFMRFFIDERDSGSILLSHFYLLIGCAMPVWTGYFLPLLHWSFPFAGLLSLGVGDTLASSIGKRYGTVKWPGTKKSIQGTLGFIGGLWLVYSFISLIMGSFLSWSLLIPFVCTGLLEAFSDQNDNVILPMYLMSFLILIVPVFPADILTFEPLHSV